jgi:hypothetical protein
VVASDGLTTTAIDHAGLVQTYRTCLSNNVEVTPGTYTVLASSMTAAPGDVLVVKGQLHGSQNATTGVATMSTWLACNGEPVSPVKTEDLERGGNHHMSMRLDGSCAPVSGNAELSLVAQTTGSDMMFDDDVDETCLDVEQYRPHAGAGATTVLVAAQGSGAGTYGVNDSYDFIEEQSLTLPSTVPVGSLVYVSAQEQAEYDPAGPDTIAMSGFAVCADKSAPGTACKRAGTTLDAGATENLPLQLYVLSQDLGFMAPATQGLRIHSSVYAADSSGTDLGGPGGTGLVDEPQDAALEAITFSPNIGHSLTQQLVAPLAQNIELPLNLSDVVVSASVTTTGASILRVASHLQTNGPSSTVTDCHLGSELWTSTGRLGTTVKTAHYMKAPYVDSALRNEGFYAVAAGSYTVREIVTCYSSGSSSSAPLVTTSGTRLMIDVFGG